MFARSVSTKVPRALIFLLLVFMLFTPFANASPLGDVNGDGDVDVQDVVLVMRHVLELDTLTSSQKLLADVNHDGDLDVTDVVLIMRYALGIITEFPEPIDQELTGQMTVHFIDVGQGDSILIEAPTQNVLIDGGNRGDVVLNYLINLGIEELDIVIGTHPHADHIGGLINVMEAIAVKEVIDPGVVHTTKTFEDYLDVIDQKNIIFTEGRAGMTRALGGGINMKILHPADPEGKSLNNASIVARIVFNQVSFLFAGDAESEAEAEMLGSGYLFNSTVLKVGHHGSRTSTTQAFLEAVFPTSAVIMCGLNNTYGHPHQETLDRLNTAGANIYRTDLHGNIIFTTDGKTYQVNTVPYVPDPYEDDSDPIGMVNINTASFEDLQLIVHIGADRAQEIISLRPFSSIDDLTRVTGIGPSRLQDIKDQGIAYVD